MNGRNKYEVKAGDTPLSPRSELVCHQTINIYLIYLLSLVFETNLIVIILVFTKCIHTPVNANPNYATCQGEQNNKQNKRRNSIVKAPFTFR